MEKQYDPLAAYLADGVLEQFRELTNEWLKIQKKLAQYESKTGEIRQVDLLKDFHMSPNTLKSWNEHGLTPIYRGGSVFYLLEDLHKFNY